MIVTFQSRASGDVIMFGDVAHAMMKIMGKEVTAQGIVTVEQLPDAIARLRAAMAADKAVHEQQWQRDDEAAEQGRDQAGSQAEAGQGSISLTQRAVPLLELLDYSLTKRGPVVWGV